MAGQLQSNAMVWRWAVASEIGTSHTRNGGRLEDAYAVSIMHDNNLFAVVADGAGSAEYGVYGAWLVCRVLTVRFREWFRENTILPNDELLTDWIGELRDHIAAIADRKGSTRRQFASTLAAIVITPGETLSLNIGDSAIVARSNDAWEVLSWPESGEYAATTYFVSDDPKPRLNIIRHHQDYDAFALFSDGIGDLALSHAEQAASPQFFDPMLRPVDNASGTGQLLDLSKKLGAYLSGSAVCERTDDDKTLILISRS